MNKNNKIINLNINNTELSELIGDIYDAALTSKWSDVLDKIIDTTQSNKAFFFLQKLDSPEPMLMEFNTTFEYPEGKLIEYQQRFDEDPFYQVSKMASEGETLNLNKHIDISSHKDTEYYKNVFVPMKSFYCLGAILIRDGVYESGYAINRAENETPYSSEDYNLLNLLTPHLSRAVHTFKTLRLYRNYANISKSIIDQADKAIVVCSSNAQVILSNEFANEKLKTSSLLAFNNGKLTVTNSVYNNQLHYYIKQCTSLSYSGIGTQESIVLEEVGEESILITVSPIRHKNDFNDIDTPCCLVSVTFQQALNWSLVAKEFELTNKEQQLIKAIYSKKKLNELAQPFGVTYNTLRTHLQTIFRKMDINSQTELLIKLNMFIR
jgi:DNA-binding CsgD family transcriptional regulator